MGGIEGTEYSQKSAAAIGSNHGHQVQVVAKELKTGRKHCGSFLHAGRTLVHEVTKGCLEWQSATQRVEKLSTAAVTLQDSVLHYWKG